MAILAQIYRSLETTFVLHFKQKNGVQSEHKNSEKADANSFPSRDYK